MMSRSIGEEPRRTLHWADAGPAASTLRDPIPAPAPSRHRTGAVAVAVFAVADTDGRRRNECLQVVDLLPRVRVHDAVTGIRRNGGFDEVSVRVVVHVLR